MSNFNFLSSKRCEHFIYSSGVIALFFIAPLCCYTSYYIEKRNATEAYKQAGYSYKNDNVAGVEGKNY
ncbi:hypothetical protein DN407_31520 (plasmid) [Bacillus sp. JAS24-2]|nr:hypothetical protein DN407_31520 [Bacillus sp. JAS24-2]